MRRFAASLLLLLLAAGCGTTRHGAYDPATNENARNVLAASFYCSLLQLRGFLPGAAADQPGKIEMLGSPAVKEKAEYPWEINLRLTIEAAPTVGYWYTVRQASPKGYWRLRRAWKGDPTGRIVINELPLPTDYQQALVNEELDKLWR